MATREGPERKRPGEKPGEESKAAIQRARSEAEAALTRAKDEERARLKAEKALAEAKEALAAARAKVEEESLTRAEAERALAEARKAIGVPTENMKTPSRGPGEEGEQRISFIVRLTVDERGQPRRTEVEHAQSGKKESFLALDIQRLAAFMKARITPVVIPETTALPPPPPVTKETLAPVPLGPATGFTVSEVRVFHRESPGDTALMLNPGEAFLVQVRFRLHGPEGPSLTTQGSCFDMRVYAREVTSGRSTLLTTYSENLVENVLEYTPQTLVSGLPPGLYRLLTLVTLQEPTKMVGYLDGPIVHVIGVQPSVKPAPLLHGPLPQ